VPDAVGDELRDDELNVVELWTQLLAEPSHPTT
jgi:hypothetical protein